MRGRYTTATRYEEINVPKPKKGCRICSFLYKAREFQHSYLEHQFMDHNKKQKDVGDRKLHDLVRCPDCGRKMQDFAWSFWSVSYRCTRCLYEWILERRARVKRIRYKMRIRRDMSGRRRRSMEGRRSRHFRWGRRRR